MLGPLNRVKLSLGDVAAEGPMCYPFLPAADVDRTALGRLGVFVPTLWPEVPNRTRARGSSGSGTWHARLLPLPIDHRYGPDDMDKVCSGAAAGAAMIMLREISREDIPIINRWRRDPVVADGVGAPRRFIGLDVDLRWFDEYLARRGTEVRCAVCMTESSQLVGMVSLTRIDYVHRNAEYNAVVGERGEQNRGIGTAATRAMVKPRLLRSQPPPDLRVDRPRERRLHPHVPRRRAFAKKARSAKALTRTGSITISC